MIRIQCLQRKSRLEQGLLACLCSHAASDAAAVTISYILLPNVLSSKMTYLMLYAVLHKEDAVIGYLFSGFFR